MIVQTRSSDLCWFILHRTYDVIKGFFRHGYVSLIILADMGAIPPDMS